MNTLRASESDPFKWYLFNLDTQEWVPLLWLFGMQERFRAPKKNKTFQVNVIFGDDYYEIKLYIDKAGLATIQVVGRLCLNEGDLRERRIAWVMSNDGQNWDSYRWGMPVDTRDGVALVPQHFTPVAGRVTLAVQVNLPGGPNNPDGRLQTEPMLIGAKNAEQWDIAPLVWSYADGNLLAASLNTEVGGNPIEIFAETEGAMRFKTSRFYEGTTDRRHHILVEEGGVFRSLFPMRRERPPMNTANAFTPDGGALWLVQFFNRSKVGTSTASVVVPDSREVDQDETAEAEEIVAEHAAASTLELASTST